MAVVDDGGGIPGPGQSGSAESSGSSAPLFELLVMLPGQLCWHQRRLVSSTEKNERRTNQKTDRQKGKGTRRRKRNNVRERERERDDDARTEGRKDRRKEVSYIGCREVVQRRWDGVAGQVLYFPEMRKPIVFFSLGREGEGRKE